MYGPIRLDCSERLAAGGDACTTSLCCGPLACTNIQLRSVNGNLQPNQQILRKYQTPTSEFGFNGVHGCELHRSLRSSCCKKSLRLIGMHRRSFAAFASTLAIKHQNDPNQNEAYGPDFRGDASLITGEPQIEPAAPACQYCRQPKGDVAQFRQQLFLHVA